MEKVTQIIGFALNVMPSWFSAVASVVAAASAVTALTPTPSDDRWVGKLYKIIEMLALNVGFAKDNPPNQQK